MSERSLGEGCTVMELPSKLRLRSFSGTSCVSEFETSVGSELGYQEERMSAVRFNGRAGTSLACAIATHRWEDVQRESSTHVPYLQAGALLLLPHPWLCTASASPPVPHKLEAYLNQLVQR